jgi:hypothetical protein
MSKTEDQNEREKQNEENQKNQDKWVGEKDANGLKNVPKSKK